MRRAARYRRQLEVASLEQLSETFAGSRDDLATAVQAHDPRWTREGAQHHHDAPVLADR